MFQYICTSVIFMNCWQSDFSSTTAPYNFKLSSIKVGGDAYGLAGLTLLRSAILYALA